jgi:hypothetical protein
MKIKMLRKVNLILLVLGALLLTNCSKEIPINLPPYIEKIVVNGLMSDLEGSLVKISKSKSSTDTNNINAITNASVQLYTENNQLFEVLTYNSFESGYKGSKLALPGSSYTIKVLYQNFEATATTKIGTRTNLSNSIYIDSIGIDSSGFPLGELSFSFSDLGTEDNYYRLNVSYWDNSLKVFAKTKNGYVFSDRTFSGVTQTLKFTVPFGFVAKGGDYKFLISLQTLNNDFTKYERSRELYNNAINSPFAEPVFIYSNIKGGLGIFGGSSLSRDTLK